MQIRLNVDENVNRSTLFVIANLTKVYVVGRSASKPPGSPDHAPLMQLQCALCGSDAFEVHYSRVETGQDAFYAFVCDKCAASID